MEGAAVVGLGADVVDDVVLEDVVVAGDADGLVRRVVDQVVRGAVADALKLDGAGRRSA